MWYAANIVLATKLKSGEQSTWPVEIITFLLEAENSKSAFQLADELGHQEALAEIGRAHV